MHRLLLLLLVICAAPGYAGREFFNHPSEVIVENELIVKLKPGATPASVISSIAPAGIVKRLGRNVDLYHVKLPPGLRKQVSSRLAAHPLTEYVEPNRIRRVMIVPPNDTAYAANQYNLATVRALQTWALLPTRYYTSSTAGTSRLKVAVIDTGADCTHPDFMNLGGSSTNSALGGQLLWNASQALLPTTMSSPTCAWQDDHGHGTHVAGILAAATNNSQGVSSLGYGLQVAVYRALGVSGTGTDADIASAVIAATDAGASIINMSLGSAGYSQTIQSAINYAWKRNVVVVAAAGNNNANEPFFPAGGNHVLGVSATDSANQKASFSNFGPVVSIAAPGDSIYGLAPTYAGTTLGAQNYTSKSGTSMAAPHVSALLGLVNMSSPGAASDALVQRIQQSATSTIANGGWHQNVGYGIIDGPAALNGTLRPATVGGIRGQVVDENEIAVAGVAVTVSGSTVTTDQSGFFRFFNLIAGSYTVAATGGGFTPSTITVGVAPGADTGVVVRMGVPQGTFTGQVMNGGTAVGGTVIQAIAGGIVHGSAVAAPDGTYSLAVPPGTYDLKASSVSFVPTLIASRSVSAGGNATVNFGIARLGTISGTVVNTAGTPVANAQLTFSAPGMLTSGATSNGNGEYSSTNLSAGTYTVLATAPTGETRLVSGITVSPNTVTPLNLVIGNFAPASVSVTPNSGIGTTQSFSFSYSDQDGLANINYTFALFNSVLDSRQGCYVIYYRATNALYLMTDDAQTLLGPLTPGNTGSIQNSQCTLSGSGSSISGSGTTLTTALAITFSPTFGGTKNIYMNAQDAYGASSGWSTAGTWAPSVVVNQPPVPQNVTPNSGTGLNATFAFTYSDPDGFANIRYAYVLINGALDSRNACYVIYARAANSAYLLSDDGSTLLGPVTPGVAGSVQNAQCTISGTGSSSSGSGTTLTLALAVTFKPAFSGPKNVYMTVEDAEAVADWSTRGTWTPVAAVNQPPTSVSASPGSGTGLNANIALTYSDPDGFANLTYTYMLISNALDSRNACYVIYVRGANAAYLLSDDGTTAMGPITPGTAGSVQNAQCIINGSGSSSSGSGNNLVLTLAVTFKNGFVGTKNVYMNTQDAAGALSGWITGGTWTPVTIVNQPPSPVSASPNSGTGLNATIAFSYSDPNGFADLSYTYGLINGALDSRNACYFIYVRNANAVYLLSDDSVNALGPVTPGTAGTVQNSQCTVSGTGSFVSTSGNNLTLTLALTFKPAFSGTQNVYMTAQDSAGAVAEWSTKGTWTPVSGVLSVVGVGAASKSKMPSTYTVRTVKLKVRGSGASAKGPQALPGTLSIPVLPGPYKLAIRNGK